MKTRSTKRKGGEDGDMRMRFTKANNERIQ